MYLQVADAETMDYRDGPGPVDGRQHRQLEKQKGKGKQTKAKSGKGQQYQGKPSPSNIPHDYGGMYNGASASQFAQFSPQNVQFLAGQRSPYQDFLQKCGGNLEQLGYGGHFSSPPNSTSSKPYRPYNSPKESPRVHNGPGKQSFGQKKHQYPQIENRKEQQQQKGQRQPNQHSQHSQQDEKSGNTGGKPDSRRRSQGNKPRRKQVNKCSNGVNVKMLSLTLKKKPKTTTCYVKQQTQMCVSTQQM